MKKTMKERMEEASARIERLQDEARRLGKDPRAYVAEALGIGDDVDDMPDAPANPSAKLHPGSKTKH